jgi:hypothetical protein
MIEIMQDFTKEKVQSVDIEQLRESNIPRIGGNAFQNGIRHYDLIEKVKEIFEQGGYKPELEKIYVAASREQTPGVETSEELERTYGKNHIKTFTFRKLLTKLNLMKFQDDEKIESIAISYHQAGIQIGYGPNVRICSNMTILGAGHSVVINSRDAKSDIESVMNILRGWAKVADYRWEWEGKIIKMMKEINVGIADMQRLIGLFTLQRIDRTKSTDPIALNQGQLNVIGANYLKELRAQREQGTGDDMTLWKIYNLGTSVHHPREMESIQDIIPANVSFGNTICDYFQVPIDKYNPEGVNEIVVSQPGLVKGFNWKRF